VSKSVIKLAHTYVPSRMRPGILHTPQMCVPLLLLLLSLLLLLL